MMPYISGNYFIGHSEESGAMARMNPDTRAFHEKVHEGATVSFMEKYNSAVHLNYEMVENQIIRALRRILHAHGHVLEAYKYGQSYEIVLLGKSCQFDRDFLRAKMPNLSRFLSHRSCFCNRVDSRCDDAETTGPPSAGTGKYQGPDC
jgi:oligoribonuclease (3'-5' exoribonuclease)